MLTRDGQVLLVVALVAAVAGRTLGVPELLAVAVGLVVLLVLVAVLVHVRRLRVEVHRSLHPPRVAVGADASIELQATNRSRRRTPVLRLHDRVRGTRGATLLLAPLGPGRAAGARYRLPTSRRGAMRIGPLDVVVADPFGLVEARIHAAAVDELLVLPPVEALLPPPPAPGDDEEQHRPATRSVAAGAGDLHSLRPYVVGDDLRRVHWRSSARHGDLLVRVDEEPWHGRTTVLLDVRRRRCTPASVEQQVSAAASVASAAHERGDLVRLVLAGQHAVPAPATGLSARDRLVDGLAVLEAVQDDPVEPTVRALLASDPGGTVVLVASDLIGEADLHALSPLRTRASRLVVVLIASEGGPPTPSPAVRALADLVVPVASGQPLRPAWDVAVAPTRRP